MGCNNTKLDATPPPPNVPRPQAQAATPVMGGVNTKLDAAPPPPNVPRPQAQAVRPVEIGHTTDPVAALNFDYSIPMLVMPFLRFKQQGRIYKSTKGQSQLAPRGWVDF